MSRTRIYAKLLDDKKYLIAIIFSAAVIAAMILLMRKHAVYEGADLEYGITFSNKKMAELGLDWKASYLEILDGLGVKRIRLSAYWDEVEPEEGKYGWDSLSWQIEEAQKREIDIVLAVGGRLPRWPECHFPGWAEKLQKEKREQKILDYLEKTINAYKGVPAIKYWQIENEPFLSHFGRCPEVDAGFFDKEIALVRSLDGRKIIITDSGELSFWIPAARRADIFGTTMYRDTYSSFLKRYIHYPIGPGFFHFKRNFAGIFAEPEDWVVIELQAEPWAPQPYQDVTPEERAKTMDLQKFKDMIEFSRQAGFKTFYLWGAEWWYWEKEAKQNPALWEYAKTLLSK